MKNILIIAALALACASCALRQASSKINWGNNSVVLPKDAEFDALIFSERLGTGPNSTVRTLVISNAVFRMNPVVIDSATTHDIAIMQQTAELLKGAALMGATGLANPAAAAASAAITSTPSAASVRMPSRLAR